MLLTETIKQSISAVDRKRKALEAKQSIEDYTKALAALSGVTSNIEAILDCAVKMKEYGIVEFSVITESIRDDLLDAAVSCGKSIPDQELTLDMVKLLQSKGDILSGQIGLVWADAAKSYSEGTRGYLSMISDLTDDPKKSRNLIEGIAKTANAPATTKGIKDLVSDVTAAKKITAAFALNSKIEHFLSKVSAQQATVLDLSPEILAWLKEKNLTGKLKLKF